MTVAVFESRRPEAEQWLRKLGFEPHAAPSS